MRILALLLNVPLGVFFHISHAFAAGAAQEFLDGAAVSAGKAQLDTVATPGLLITNIINVILGMAGLALVVILVYAGYLYLTAQGAEEKIAQAKRMIAAAIIGIVIIASAYAISLFVITQLTKALGWLGGETAYAASGSTSTLKGLDAAGKNAGFLSTTPVSELVGRVINTVLALTGIIFVITLVYGGILYLTAAGDEEKVTNAKRMMGNSVIGIVIIASAYAIAIFVFDRLIDVFKK